MKKFLVVFSVLISLNIMAEPYHECTSWMVFSDFTKNNTNMLHKNRDNKLQLVNMIMSSKNSPRKWVGLGNPKHKSPNMGFNTSGLAAAVNSGDRTTYVNRNLKGKNTPKILKIILESCDNAKEVVEKLKELVEKQDYYHGSKSGSIFLFIDTKEGYICEMTAHFVAVRRYDSNYNVRANLGYFPEMEQFRKNLISKSMSSHVRKYAVQYNLNKALDTKNKIEDIDMIKIARDVKKYYPQASGSSVCGGKTISALTMVIDREYPDVLSYGWAFVGNPRHTVYIPLPIVLEKMPENLIKGEWSANALARLKKLGHTAAIPEQWLDFEKKSYKKFHEALAEARTLLKNDKKEEAVKLLNKRTEEIWEEAQMYIFSPEM